MRNERCAVGEDDKESVVLMIRRPPRSTQSRSSAASDVYKRQVVNAYCYNDSYFALSIDRRIYVFDATGKVVADISCLLYTSPSPRDRTSPRMPSPA